MKYFVITYNYLTLSKALIYANHVWGKNNTQIFFLPTVSDTIENKTLKENNVVKVELLYHKHIPLFYKAISESKVEANSVVTLMDSYIKGYTSEDVSIVVFKDDYLRECILIERLKVKYKNIKVLLMEEGLGLYAQSLKAPFSIRRILFSIIKSFLGVPKYYLNRKPMGFNPAVNKIICSNPDALKHRGFSEKAELEVEHDVFDNENCNYLLKNLFKVDLGGKKFDFAFLTQPIYPRSKLDDEKYEKFLSELVFTLKKRGSVLIKKHPRDKWNYDSFKDQNVQICDDKVNHIPFECVWGAYGKPQMITLFSSAVCISSSKKRSIFLYNLLPESIGNGRLDEKIVNNPKYVVCNSFAELKDVLEV